MVKIIFTLILIATALVFFTSSVSASIEIGSYDDEVPSISLGDDEGGEPAPPTTNCSNCTHAKYADYWDGYDTPSDIPGSEFWYNHTAVLEGQDLWVNVTGDIMTGDLNMTGSRLTEIGEILMKGVIRAQDIIPDISSMYSLGNETNKFKEAFINNITVDNANVSGYQIKESDDALVIVLK
jgi:hypothetical protein